MVLVTQNEAVVYQECMKHIEGAIETDKRGRVWRKIYTANISLPGMHWKQIAGYLSALQRRGLYERLSRDCGLVKITDIQITGV